MFANLPPTFANLSSFQGRQIFADMIFAQCSGTQVMTVKLNCFCLGNIQHFEQ